MKPLYKDRYKELNDEWKKGFIERCCDPSKETSVQGSDCCYIDWKGRLQTVKISYEGKTEVVELKEKELDTLILRRDRLKAWYEELGSADEKVHTICDQLDHLRLHIIDICNSTVHTVDAVNILFCMIRDFYGQIDEIKERYDDIIKCIECLNDPVFSKTEGIWACLIDYNKYLEAIIQSRDGLVALIIKAITLSNQLYQNIGEHRAGADFGLNRILGYWKTVFKCTKVHEDEEEHDEDDRYHNKEKETGKHEDEICALKPPVEMPICHNLHYKQIEAELSAAEEDITQLRDRLADLKDEQERLLTCKVSLEKAIDLVDPTKRCN